LALNAAEWFRRGLLLMGFRLLGGSAAYPVQFNHLSPCSDSRSHLSDTYSKGPDPEGLSGCGLWFIKSMIVESMSNVDVRFCGILRQYVREENLIYANKTKVINDMFQKLKLK
jgi:hypothetical protein